jgi:hypothetical protein
MGGTGVVCGLQKGRILPQQTVVTVMPSTDPALEAAMALAARRRDIPETLAEIYTAWNLCFRAYCTRYDRPWPSHRVVPDFVTYLREETTVTRVELIHAVDAVVFGLEETTGLAGPLKTALRARVLSDIPRPEKEKATDTQPSSGDGAFHHHEAALTRVMVAMDQEAFTHFKHRQN